MMSFGIDIVDISRVTKLYKNYKNRLHRYLSKNELAWLEQSKRKAETLAKIMAIKEAVFKSLEIPWFGLEGWKRIGLKRVNGKVNIRLSKEFLKKEKGRMNFWVSTAQTEKFVVAHVIFEKLAYDSGTRPGSKPGNTFPQYPHVPQATGGWRAESLTFKLRAVRKNERLVP